MLSYIKSKFYLVWIGLRYVLVKRKDNFGGFIALVSVMGISLGVAVLITVLSVMNGFSKEIRTKILSINPHITLKSSLGELSDWRTIVAALQQIPGITAVAPYLAQHGLLMLHQYSKPIITIGIDPLNVNNIYPLAQHLVSGSMDNLIKRKYNFFLGKDLADYLGIKVDDQVVLMIPQVNISPVGVSPKIKKVTVGGIFKSGTMYDQNYIFFNLDDMKTLYAMRDGITGIQIKLQDELAVKPLKEQIATRFNYKYWLSDWTMEFKALLEAMKLEKIVMSCILLLIIAVAAFNLVSSLIMLVMDKRSDIAILRVMGLKRKDVVLIFMLQGSFIGLIGTSLGLGLGLILAFNITDVANYLQSYLGIKFVAEEAYFINFLPSKVYVKDVVWVVLAALSMSFGATLYPAYRASKIKPAEALRYE